MSTNRNHFNRLNFLGFLGLFAHSCGCGQQGLEYGMWADQTVRDDQAIMFDNKRALGLDLQLKQSPIYIKV